MMAAGETTKVPRLVCDATAPLQQLYLDFQSADQAARTPSTTTIPTIQVGERTIQLFRKGGENWDAYSRKFKVGDDRWLTVQICLNHSRFFPRFNLQIFDKNGERKIGVNSFGCEEYLYISQEDAVWRTFFQSALQAVTGKDFPVLVR